MKKILLVFGLVLTSMVLTAQSRWAFGVELEGGISGRADLEENDHVSFGIPSTRRYFREEFKRRPGAGAGLWSEYLFSQRFGLRLGVNYSHWRSFYETESITYNSNDVMMVYSRDRMRHQQNQLRIPLEGKIYFGSAQNRVRVFVKTGVQLSYLLSEVNFSNNYYGALGQIESYEYTFAAAVDLQSAALDVQRWEASLVSGLGVNIDRVTLSIQRNWSFHGKNEQLGHPYDICSGYGYYNISRPYYSEQCEIRNLEQTSLKFAYRMF